MNYPPAWAFLRGCTPVWRRTGIECTACHVDKKPDDFYMKANGKREAMCKRCRSARVLARHHARKANG